MSYESVSRKKAMMYKKGQKSQKKIWKRCEKSEKMAFLRSQKKIETQSGNYVKSVRTFPPHE